MQHLQLLTHDNGDRMATKPPTMTADEFEALRPRLGRLALDTIEVASNQAGPVALLAGGADVIVSDWTWAMRQRSLGEKLK